MTVRELVEALQRWNPEARVRVRWDCKCAGGDVEAVRGFSGINTYKLDIELQEQRGPEAVIVSLDTDR